MDNSVFSIEGNQLKIIESPDFESKDSYSVRIETKDSGGLTRRKKVLNVNDVNEAPADLSVSAFTFDENIESGSAVATLSTLDPDFGDAHTYKLDSDQGYFDNGTGSTSGSGYAGMGSNSAYYDNSLFTIDDNQLKIINSPDFESKSSYLLRLQTIDAGGMTLDKEITVYVANINESPENVLLSTFAFNENIVGGSAIATLSTQTQTLVTHIRMRLSQ